MIAWMSRWAWLAGAPVRWALVTLIRAYRVTLGLLLGGQCRFHPSCSAYAEEAIRVHGALRGSALSVWRVLRCSPLTAGGPDPVPAARHTAGSTSRMTSSHGQGVVMTESYRAGAP